MANISSYISAIEFASRGEQVRDAIIQALNAMNNQGGNASSLDGHAAGDYALKTWVQTYVSNQLGDIESALNSINGVNV